MEDNKKKKDSSSPKEAAPAEAKRKPIKTFRVEDVSASIWAHPREVQGEPRTFYSVTFERSYKDRDGGYRYTKWFDPDSLGKLVTVIQQAADFIGEQRQRQDAA